MAIVVQAPVVEAQMWPQGDIRDPLGLWGVRQAVTGDASGGSIKVLYEVTSAKRAAFVYTCYDINWSQLTGAVTGDEIKVRLLTGWPNIDPQAGVQAYGSNLIRRAGGGGNLTPPIAGSVDFLVSPQQRLLLLFDPRPQAIDLVIVEVEWQTNVDLATYSFEGYGYYWDRSVMDAPGGPRHPGSN